MATPFDEFTDEDDTADSSEDIPEASSPRRRLGVGAAIVLVLVALAVTVLIGVVRTGTGTVASPSAAVTPPAAAPTTDPQVRLYVDVTGAVKSPGMFVLPKDARVLDAISAAGGFTAKAQRDAVNLARPLSDGEQLVVPRAGAASSGLPTSGPPASAGSGTAPPAASGKVDLNTATQEQLEELPRIGPALAQRILQWRKDNGRFTSADDLRAVSGIGDKMLATLRDLVTV